MIELWRGDRKVDCLVFASFLRSSRFLADLSIMRLLREIAYVSGDISQNSFLFMTISIT